MKNRTSKINFFLIQFFIFLGCFLIVFRTVFHVIGAKGYYLALVEDDFYYYAATARNIVAHGVSTFDGVTITNGYHPLWMGIIIAITAITNSSDTFFIGLSIILSLCFYFTTQNLYRFVDEHFLNSGFHYAILLFIDYLCFRLIVSGMETAILLPLFSYLILLLFRNNYNTNFKHQLILGLMFSLAILSRLDVLIFLGMYVVVWTIIKRDHLNQLLKAGSGLAIGLLPTLLYFLWNYFSYGHLFTVSAMSKQLPFTEIFHTQLLTDIWNSKEGKIGSILIPIGIVIILFFRKAKLRYANIGMIYLVLFFPIVYFFILGVRSSWILFPWYLYPIIFALLLSMIIISDSLSGKILTKNKKILSLFIQPAVMILLVAQLCFLIYKSTFGIQINPGFTFTHSQKIAEFINTHPGSYAMGDKAGLASYISNTPILQLEGLAADYALLEHIRQSDLLLPVLHEHHIDYLIVSVYKPLIKTLKGYYVETPNALESGITSPKMKDYLQSEPVLHYTASNEESKDYEDNTGLVPPKTHTYIFALK